MRLYTSAVIAQYLSVSERRVRQLRDEGIIAETKPGLYALLPTINRYIAYLRGNGSGKEDLNEERAKYTKAKREAAEMENRLRRGELHETKDIELALSTMLLNFRTRTMAIPAKLSPALAQMGGDQAGIFDRLKSACAELLEELSDYAVAFTELPKEAGNGTEETAGEKTETEEPV